MSPYRGLLSRAAFSPVLDCVDRKLKYSEVDGISAPKHMLLSSAGALFLPRSWFLFVLF